MKHDAVMLMGRIHDLTQKWLRGELAAAGLSGIVPSHGDVLALLFMKSEATMHELAAFAHRTGPISSPGSACPSRATRNSRMTTCRKMKRLNFVVAERIVAWNTY